VYRTLNTNKKVKYRNFLHKVGRSWISEVQNQSSPVLIFSCQRRIQHQGGLKRTHQIDSPGISGYINLKKIFAGREGKKKYPARQCKMCAAHKRSEARHV
jgi:hypothetical protein